MNATVGKAPNFALEIALLGMLALLWGSSYLFIKGRWRPFRRLP